MTDSSPARHPLEGAAQRIWVLVLLRGVLAATIGFYALYNPMATLLAVIWVLAIYWVIDGVFLLMTGFAGTAGKGKWALILFRALLSILAGALIFANPALDLFTAVILTAVLGAQAIIGGALELAAAFKAREHLDKGWVLILNGALAIVFGVMLLAAPLVSAVVLTQVIGAFALVFGLGAVFFSFRLQGSAAKTSA